MQKIVVVIPSYNNAKWYEKNLLSVVGQDYSNFQILYTDDLSTDGTPDLVEEFIKKHNVQNIKLIRNTERVGAMKNLYDMIHSCQDMEIIITLDGDDFLAHENVLKRVSKEYDENEQLIMSWGSYQDWPGMTMGCAKPIAQHIIDNNLYRKSPWCFSHLRSFRAGAFRQIPEDDFKHDNKWMKAGWDLPIMWGLAERSNGNIKYIPDILYYYNNQNELSDFRINLSEQQNIERIVRARRVYGKN
jgi:glycosyltransferase involved in cell wall biosynthesis